ncbi:uncharacterized protein OCT59_010420 [Rhizophagus irregularis]|uniref:Uncharacterized protein n=3 Tax=Rhizophagus irregularis TaxID=588596 RepID=A0A915ZYD3_9GLOM|nr:hypothetical protein RirG_072870 [Rhizophagus irregularis DAOM 197198w]UZO19120.1 hypothetical protein OCT59_010420 [Rhizophagus irregularis]GET61461.1 hypothetical protein GLOIN_2v1571072 [Rhizophagus irregularis DAOM 181602=DAOM 197198]CAB4476201.1 unnamed protein product [Rhizophagus irregularis]CAB5091558.1 unnamed protein product [Rhizophagus irregularis]
MSLLASIRSIRQLQSRQSSRFFRSTTMCLKTYKKASDPSELSSERIVERLGTYLRQYHHREEDWNTQSSNIINVIQNKLTKNDLLNIDDKEFQHKGIISQYVLKAAKELNEDNSINETEMPFHTKIDDLNVKTWTPKEVKQFLKEKLSSMWTAKEENFFDKFQINGQDLLNLRSDTTRPLGLARTFDSELQKLVKPLNAKTIYIKSFDKSFVKHIIHNNNDLRNLLRKFYGKGLEPIKEDAGNYCEYPTLIRSFQGIRNNEFYRVDLSEFFLRNKFSERVNWKQIEDKVTEDESFSAVRNEIQIPTLLYDRIITDASGITKIEWDGTFYDHKRLFLCEAKHNMSEKHLTNLVKRVKKFQKGDYDDHITSKVKGKTCIGVACGTYFSQEEQSLADKKKLISVFPGGGRYRVDFPFRGR